jgi:large subunit ribosomal protein L36e
MARSGIAAGRGKGFVTKQIKADRTKKFGRGKKTLVREVIREVAGFAPYERHMMELIKIGSASTLKRATKFAKARLGTQLRTKRKREELVAAVQNLRKLNK